MKIMKMEWKKLTSPNWSPDLNPLNFFLCGVERSQEWFTMVKQKEAIISHYRPYINKATTGIRNKTGFMQSQNSMA